MSRRLRRVLRGAAAPLIHGLRTGAASSDKEKAEANSALTLGLSAIIGSGMLAFLLAPGICALGAGQVLKLKRRPLAKNIGFYVLSLTSLCIFFRDAVVEAWEAMTLLSYYGIYLVVTWAAPMANARYRTYRYGPLPQDRRQKNFVEERREQMQQLMAGNGGGVGGSVELVDARSGGGGLGSSDEDDDAAAAESSMLVRGAALLVRPMKFAFSITCPDCSQGAKYETFYAVTLLMGFLWVSLFSYAISEVIEAWESKLGVSTIILGITLVAVGGEIPDTIQSLAVAKKGYGSLAVANCVGAQVVNICVGLGLPWLLSALWGQPVVLAGHAEVQTLVWFHVAGITFFSSITLGLVVLPLLYSQPIEPKATLTPAKGLVLLLFYFILLISYLVACQTGDAMLPRLGARHALVALGLVAVGAGVYVAHRVRQRRKAELQQMHEDFYRIKFRKKAKETPPNGHGQQQVVRKPRPGRHGMIGAMQAANQQLDGLEEGEQELFEEALNVTEGPISDIGHLQQAVAQVQQQAHARARARGMSSGYAAMSNSLLRRALDTTS